jgi:hypothetical protein
MDATPHGEGIRIILFPCAELGESFFVMRCEMPGVAVGLLLRNITSAPPVAPSTAPILWFRVKLGLPGFQFGHAQFEASQHFLVARTPCPFPEATVAGPI